jgi:hypothetical protein
MTTSFLKFVQDSIKLDLGLGEHAWIYTHIRTTNTQTVSIFATIGRLLVGTCSENLRSAAFVIIMTRIAVFYRMKALLLNVSYKNWEAKHLTIEQKLQRKAKHLIDLTKFPENVLSLESGGITFVPLSGWRSPTDPSQDAYNFVCYWGTFKFSAYDELVPCFALFSALLYLRELIALKLKLYCLFSEGGMDQKHPQNCIHTMETPVVAYCRKQRSNRPISALSNGMSFVTITNSATALTRQSVCLVSNFSCTIYCV